MVRLLYIFLVWVFTLKIIVKVIGKANNIQYICLFQKFLMSFELLFGPGISLENKSPIF